jgi:hypothetical protein
MGRGALRRRSRLLHGRLAGRGRSCRRRRLACTGTQEHSNQKRKPRDEKFFHGVNHRYIITSPQTASADVIKSLSSFPHKLERHAILPV